MKTCGGPVSVCFDLFWNSWFRLFRFYTETENFDVSIEPKQTEDQPKQFDREHILVFFGKFRVVSVCFGFIRNSSICFECFHIGSKHRNKPNQTKTKQNVFGFMKQTKTVSRLTMATPWVRESTTLWLSDLLSKRIFRKIFTVTCMVVILFLLCYNRNALWLESQQPAIAEMPAIPRTEQQHECQ
jgi:hypothetical protein